MVMKKSILTLLLVFLVVLSACNGPVIISDKAGTDTPATTMPNTADTSKPSTGDKGFKNAEEFCGKLVPNPLNLLGLGPDATVTRTEHTYPVQRTRTECNWIGKKPLSTGTMSTSEKTHLNFEVECGSNKDFMSSCKQEYGVTDDNFVDGVICHTINLKGDWVWMDNGCYFTLTNVFGPSTEPAKTTEELERNKAIKEALKRKVAMHIAEQLKKI